MAEEIDVVMMILWVLFMYTHWLVKYRSDTFAEGKPSLSSWYFRSGEEYVICASLFGFKSEIFSTCRKSKRWGWRRSCWQYSQCLHMSLYMTETATVMHPTINLVHAEVTAWKNLFVKDCHQDRYWLKSTAFIAPWIAPWQIQCIWLTQEKKTDIFYQRFSHLKILNRISLDFPESHSPTT